MEEGQRQLLIRDMKIENLVVLILVVMEEGQRPEEFINLGNKLCVLILVVMEEGQRRANLLHR